jgi:hypothetical protein
MHGELLTRSGYASSLLPVPMKDVNGREAFGTAACDDGVLEYAFSEFGSTIFGFVLL